LKRTVKRVEVAEVRRKGWRVLVERNGSGEEGGGSGTGSLFVKNCKRIIEGAELRRKEWKGTYE
jgi:hypothetical protein